jgi:hypothetical protein
VRRLLAGSILLGSVAAGIAVTLFVPPRNKGTSGIPPRIARRLSSVRVAREFAPTLKFNSNEVWRPIDRAHYVASSELWRGRWNKKHRSWVLAKAGPCPASDTCRFTARATLEHLPQGGLSCPPARCHYFLKLAGLHVRKVPKAYSTILETTPLGKAVRTVYWHVAQDPDGEIAVQYWFFYAFNKFANWHDGDWEQITIRLAFDGEPLEAGYSSHGNGLHRDWGSMQRAGNHPVVYVGLGSHANYFRAGKHKVPECHHLCKDKTDGLGGTLGWQDYRLVELASPVFLDGDYTPHNYLLRGTKPIDRGKITVEDPGTRASWDNPLGWLGKTDPAD